MHYSESRIYDNNGVCGDATEGEKDLEIDMVPKARRSGGMCGMCRNDRESYVTLGDVMYAGSLCAPRP